MQELNYVTNLQQAMKNLIIKLVCCNLLNLHNFVTFQTLDRNKEGFKTNKSFEIRRLQAKAEREKEKKKRAIFGSRVSQFSPLF